MTRLYQFVAAICLIQALTMCFVLSPIKAIAYSATMNAPAVWWVLDPDTAWQSLHCFNAENPITCFQTISEIFQLGRAIATRLVICLSATAIGLLMFQWVCFQLSRDP